MGSNSWSGADQEQVLHLTRRDTGDVDRLSTSVLLALDELPDYDVTDADRTLFEEIDPDALDALFRPESGGMGAGKVTFTVDNYEVTATNTGEVLVRAPRNPDI